MMKKFSRIALFALSMLLAAAVFAGCGEKKTDGKVYQVVADDSFAPFDFLDSESGKYTGIDMDLLAAIAEDQGFQYEINNCGWDAALGNLASGQADAMIAGMTITPDRQKTYDFTEGYFSDGQIMLVKSDSSIASIEDLKGKTVAVKTGTQSAKYAESVKSQYGFEIVTYKDSPSVYQAVMSGIDSAGFEDYSVISYQIKAQSLDLKVIGEVVNVGQYGLAVNKGTNAELIEMFNKGLANIKSNGKYAEILAKYGITAD